MSSNLPEYPAEPSSLNAGFTYALSFREPGPSGREWIIAASLLLVTFCTAAFAGLFHQVNNPVASIRIFLSRPATIVYGLPFAIPLVSILLAHELGHYLACRYYGMRCTPPFFIPAPLPIAGTLGAFIKIKSQFLHKRALFDVGIAGPLAGFMFTLPALWIGISLSKIVPKVPIVHNAIIYGEPLVLRLFASIILGYAPDKQDLIVHPMAMAAWVGLLATSLNLLPIWQLDGGHIAYAILGRKLHKFVSAVSIAGLLLIGFWNWQSPSYLLFGVLLLLFGSRMRFYHPEPLQNGETLGVGRIVLGLAALLILIASFIPVPITIT